MDKIKDKVSCIVSIIVPLYNAERYLKRCLDSILAQEYASFELILVDDGSTDHCDQICEAYAQDDGRIRTIHQLNQGAAAARNAGLSVARGEYIMFCDADDVVSPMWIKRLLDLAQVYPECLPVGGYCNRQEQLGSEWKLHIDSGKCYDAKDYDMLGAAGVAGYLCNALYRMDVIKSNALTIRSRRNAGDYNEDLVFALQYMRHMKGCVYTGYADYWYNHHEGSLSTSYQKHYFEKYQEKYCLWSAFIDEFNGVDHEQKKAGLATRYLYPFLKAMEMEVTRGAYSKFKEIVHSDAVQDCLKRADATAENPWIIHLMEEKRTVILWVIYILHEWKGRMKK